MFWSSQKRWVLLVCAVLLITAAVFFRPDVDAWLQANDKSIEGLSNLASIVVGALGLIAIAAAWETYRLAAADRRPWVKIEAQITKGLVYERDDVAFRLDIILTNVGNTPAESIRISARTHVSPRALTASAQGEVAPGDNEYVLLPGDRLSRHYRASVPASLAQTVANSDEGYFKLVAVISVGYRQHGHRRNCETRQAVSLYMEDRQGLVLDGRPLEPGDLYLKLEDSKAH